MSITPSKKIPDDPVPSLEEFGVQFRAGVSTAEAAVRTYLSRISALNPALGALEEVCDKAAIETAKAMDRLIADNHDLGPLMGVPIIVKDIFAVSGTRTAAGSNMQVDDLIGPEGSFVRRLRQAGCIILGKSRTTEFAFSPSGINDASGTPRNPWDAGTFRIPGGSSSGSAVALAAGLCALAVGSDTGGSVRVPAALNGVVGMKTSVGLWDTDGVFSLSTTFDSIGFFTRSVADAALVFAALESRGMVSCRAPEALRLAVPSQYFRQGLDGEVRQAFDAASQTLREGGAVLVPLELPEALERTEVIGKILAAELIASVGRERIMAALPDMDPFVRLRVSAGLDIPAPQYIALKRRQNQIEAEISRRLGKLDGWLSPTVPVLAPERAACGNGEEQARMNARLTQNSQPGNMFGHCGISLPLPTETLPIGLQLMAPGGQDENVISAAAAIERLIGRGKKCDLGGFPTEPIA